MVVLKRPCYSYYGVWLAQCSVNICLLKADEMETASHMSQSGRHQCTRIEVFSVGRKEKHDFESNVFKSCNVKDEKILLTHQSPTGSPIMKKESTSLKCYHTQHVFNPSKQQNFASGQGYHRSPQIPFNSENILPTGSPCGRWLPNCFLTEHNSMLAHTWYTTSTVQCTTPERFCS